MKNYKDTLTNNAIANNFVKEAMQGVPNDIAEILSPNQFEYYYTPMIYMPVVPDKIKTTYEVLHCKTEKYIVNLVGQSKLQSDVRVTKEDLLARGQREEDDETQNDKLIHLLIAFEEKPQIFSQEVLNLKDKYKKALTKYTQALQIKKQKGYIDGEYNIDICLANLESVLNKLDEVGLFTKGVPVVNSTEEGSVKDADTTNDTVSNKKNK